MQERNRKSRALYDRALRVMVGGVSSPVRAFKSVGGTPLFIAKGKGSQIWDEDGNRYTDYVCSWGALILGHADRRVLSSVTAAMKSGTSFGAPTDVELRLGEKICTALPSVEKIRFVNSGTEATMSALRLARAYTKRSRMVKFQGCYHGHSDPFLTSAGSGMATLDLPYSAGIPEGAVQDTMTVPYNDPEALESVFDRRGESIAAVILEPVAGNMGVIPPSLEFLTKLRKLCSNNGAVLIFDEVITGFRVAYGGAQEVFNVRPDLTTLGKIIGGGFPVGAYGGEKEIMAMVSPEGPVYQAGTLSGNPVAMSAGLKTLSLLNKSSYARLDRKAAALEVGLIEGARRASVPFNANRVGSMLGVFFDIGPTRNFDEAKRTDSTAYRKFFWEMLREGTYLPPSAYETLFVTLAHSSRDIDATAEAAGRAFRAIRN